MVKSSRWKDGKGSLLLLGVSLCLSIICAEMILRLLGHYGEPVSFISNSRLVDDPILDWRYLRNSELRIGGVVYQYNRSGFRDVDHEVKKLPGVRRIVVLGDSVTEGYGVAWKYVFAHRLQSELGDHFEVINIAMGGLNTPQEVHLFEQEGLPYRPDLVVMNFVLNDADFFTKFGAARRYQMEKDAHIGLLLNMPVHPWVKRFLKSSALVYFVKGSVENLKGRLLGVEDSDYYSRLWGKPENRRKITAGFHKLAELQRKGRFEVLVLIWPLLTEFKHYRFELIHQWVTDEAINAGLKVFDLLPEFTKLSYRELQVTAEDNVHPNALGHEVGAKAFNTWYRAFEEKLSD
jgi:lysophospholipase L1-like esterase